ncbi:MAG: CPBP family intramembrane metalloprotease [Candidatus Omnitrophota bacterium]|nr:CPBP family intramembrane metalloprotease [Candidatus Omnitrophota bacterium]
MKIETAIILRLCISVIVIVIPIAFLSKEIYGSFIFTFSIPIIWQIGFLGKSIDSLGLRINFLKSSILAGVVSGCLFGFLGGSLLKYLGITGHFYSNAHKLQFSIGDFNMAFLLQKELGYRLLNMSNSAVGICIYFLFCIFIIGLGEEIFWRGFIQKKLSGYFSPNKAIWFTAILFSLMHFYVFTILPVKTGISFLLLITLVGWIWGYLFTRFDNIWSSAISHGIVAFIIWKYYFFNLS